MLSFRNILLRTDPGAFTLDDLLIRPICDDNDLWYATVECQLKPGQEDFVNPAGFSIGRAYLAPEKNVPCVICKTDRTPIGYIVFRIWSSGDAYSWSYYLDQNYQGKGLGRKAARLAVQILKSASPDMPIKLSAEADNQKAHALYQSLGFTKLEEMDGDDFIFQL